jgi:membrane-associated phospholipid phosphatase
METSSQASDTSRSRWWLLLPGGLTVYCIILAGLGDLRVDHVAVTVLVAGLMSIGPRARRFVVDMTPYVLVALGYDLVRYGREAFVRSENVLGCGLRNAELSVFSVAPGVTAQDWFAAHHWPVVDVLAAVPYLIFIYVAFIYAAYLFFVDRPRMRYYLWSLALANYIAYAMYIIVPAAPPWYIRAHGCTIDMAALPSPAALIRVDHLLGMSYFQDFYSRASSVFGAMPSMHCAYPMIGLLTAWTAAGWKTRPLHVVYALWMIFAAVYLDHHWILDGLAGWTVAAVSVGVVSFARKRLAHFRSLLRRICGRAGASEGRRGRDTGRS